MSHTLFRVQENVNQVEKYSCRKLLVSVSTTAIIYLNKIDKISKFFEDGMEQTVSAY